MKLLKRHWALFLYLLVYGGLNLLFLTDFPLVHSDESWLGGLSRHMLAEGSLAVTEPFFTAKPRFQHCFKSLFHLLQQAAIAAGGFTPFALRALSLFAALCTIAAFYFCALRLVCRRGLALACTLVLSLDIQFIYAAHFARSEIMLLFFLCLCLFTLAGRALTVKSALSCAAFTAAALLIHPNAFFLACCCGTVLLAEGLIYRKSLKPLAVYCGATGLLALLPVLASYAISPHFLKRYFAYGAGEFDLAAGPAAKFTDLFGFFSRLWHRQSGTYYLPDIRPQLALGLGLCLLCGIFALAMHKEQPAAARSCLLLLAAQTGLVGGIAALGRLNQTSIVFLLPGSCLLLAFAVQLFSEHHTAAALCGLAALSLVFSCGQILPIAKGPGYEEYTRQIAQFVPADAPTLANLNTGFYFEDGALLDYRNLPFAQGDEGVARFCRQSGVEYILYSDELDYIYEHRPYFNVIYGSPLFVEELRRFCREECTPLGQFYNPRYGKRINALMNDPDYGHVTVYKVN